MAVSALEGRVLVRGRILVVEDDDHVRELVQGAFEQRGYEVVVARDGREGLKAFFDSRPGLVVLDILMPKMNGWEVLGRIREVSDVPVIVLTAMGREHEVIRGLRSGADDYMVKPTRISELLARAEATLRRVSGDSKAADEYRDAVLHIDFQRHRVFVEGNPVDLSPMEFRLLTTLVRNADSVLGVDRLLDICWGDGEGGPENVRVYVGYLRKKLGDDGRTRRLIETVREFGYRYITPPKAAGSPT